MGERTSLDVKNLVAKIKKVRPSGTGKTPGKGIDAGSLGKVLLQRTIGLGRWGCRGENPVSKNRCAKNRATDVRVRR